MEDKRRKTTGPILAKNNKPITQSPSKPDFENHLADFETEFLEFIAQTDQSINLDLLRNPNPPIAEPPTPPPPETMHPATKEELGLPLRLTGPKVINSDILGDEIILESDVRVKGTVYGRNEVHIGPSCVIEGNVISGGLLQIEKGCRIHEAVIGSEVEINGPAQIEGPVVSRGKIVTRGRVEAQLLFAAQTISLLPGEQPEQVRVASGLIMARGGKIEVQTPVWLANVQANPAIQYFYLNRQANGETQMHQIPPAGVSNLTAILTTLTDSELEKLINDLAGFEQQGKL